MAYRLANVGGRAALVAGEDYFDLETVSGGALGSDPMAALQSLAALSELSVTLGDHTPTGQLADAELDAPVPKPGNCYAVGLNYRNHALESGMPIPDVPMIFTKHTTCITGPNADVEMRSDYVDYEAELVVVIGRDGKDIAATDAWDYIAGLCVGQDISDRPAQFVASPPQFNLGKSFDTFGPIGPVLISKDALVAPESLEISCEVNGEQCQKDNTGDLIFHVPEILAYLSEIVTLRTGDVIFTGTPGGVGAVQGKFLKDGDILTTSIEGLGTLRNRCVRVSDHSRAHIVPEQLQALIAAAKEKQENE
ncbi:MAG: fumarylacetoacetate hydrolase family protein [Halioglobus sp.]